MLLGWLPVAPLLRMLLLLLLLLWLVLLLLLLLLMMLLLGWRQAAAAAAAAAELLLLLLLWKPPLLLWPTRAAANCSRAEATTCASLADGGASHKANAPGPKVVRIMPVTLSATATSDDTMLRIMGCSRLPIACSSVSGSGGAVESGGAVGSGGADESGGAVGSGSAVGSGARGVDAAGTAAGPAAEGNADEANGNVAAAAAPAEREATPAATDENMDDTAGIGGCSSGGGCAANDCLAAESGAPLVQPALDRLRGQFRDSRGSRGTTRARGSTTSGGCCCTVAT